MEANLLLLEAAFFAIALLYSMTGHGGGSGYIAIMALLGMAPQEIKPLALGMNIIVATVATIQFYRAGHFRRALFLPFILGSVPLAMLGGYLQLPTRWFNLLMGLALIFAALRIAVRRSADLPAAAPNFNVAILAGAAIGLLSGLVGVGGGIFLTPLILLLGWANPKQAAAVSAPFILLNSLSGLAGFSMHAAQAVPPGIIWLAVAVLAGGLLGAHLGSRSLPMKAVSRVLSVVLLIGGFKLLYV
ncbi:MAG: sulfite exporter TauE/SafE family protein [Nitrosomonadales bacterium]|nr:sulfite exporter TauE/SafE family protein [Nitrosomonadales bacterium]